jgi:tRNA splicing endonuclease
MSFPEKVRISCLLYTSPLVTLNVDALNKFAEDITIKEIHDFVNSSDGLSTNRFDQEISFKSQYEEAGFLVIAHGLDFGSGFRNLLHKHRHGQGAWLTIRAGLVQLGIQDSSCSASWLVSLTLADIQTLFDLKSTSDAETDLFPLAEQLYQSLHEFGTNLIELGFSTHGEYIEYKLVEGNYSASKLVEYLVTDFPLTFQDEYHIPSHQSSIYFYKKAQLVVSEIYMRFHQGGINNEFNFADIDSLTSFVDNVVVATMRLTGIILCKDALNEKINKGEYLLKGSEEEIALRATACQATELLVQRLLLIANLPNTNSTTDSNNNNNNTMKVNAQQLCNWLWGCFGKANENRNYPRHLTPSTSFY